MSVSQDLQLEELKQQVSTLKCQNEQLQTAVTQQASQIQQHKDQYNLLKVQLGACLPHSVLRSWKEILCALLVLNRDHCEEYVS